MLWFGVLAAVFPKPFKMIIVMNIISSVDKCIPFLCYLFLFILLFLRQSHYVEQVGLGKIYFGVCVCMYV